MNAGTSQCPQSRELTPYNKSIYVHQYQNPYWSFPEDLHESSVSLENLIEIWILRVVLESQNFKDEFSKISPWVSEIESLI